MMGTHGEGVSRRDHRYPRSGVRRGSLRGASCPTPTALVAEAPVARDARSRSDHPYADQLLSRATASPPPGPSRPTPSQPHRLRRRVHARARVDLDRLNGVLDNAVMPVLPRLSLTLVIALAACGGAGSAVDGGAADGGPGSEAAAADAAATADGGADAAPTADGGDAGAPTADGGDAGAPPVRAVSIHDGQLWRDGVPWVPKAVHIDAFLGPRGARGHRLPERSGCLGPGGDRRDQVGRGGHDPLRAGRDFLDPQCTADNPDLVVQTSSPPGRVRATQRSP